MRRATPDELVRAKLTEGLTTQDGRIVYPIRNDIPMMMSEEGRALP